MRKSFEKSQHGVTLIELMVGIAIGLLVVAVAMGALIVSRSISGTVSDATGIQQQAAHAMRIIGQQVRQAGAMKLNLDTTAADDNQTTNILAPVAVETTAPAGGASLAFTPAANPGIILSGTDTPSVTLTTGYRRYAETLTISATAAYQLRNCLGGPGDGNADTMVQSVFTFDATTHQLKCGGNDTLNSPQPIIGNVADFQVRYLAQTSNPASPNPTIRYFTATQLGDSTNFAWAQVQAIEICLVLYGDEAIDMPDNSVKTSDGSRPLSSYIGCDGSAVDMTTLSAPRTRRLHIAFHNVFQIRSQGLVSSGLVY